MLNVYLLNKEDVNGLFVSIGNRRLRIDRYGYLLWKKYKWSVTYSNFYPHRYENGRLIAFHRQLLGLHKTNEKIRFDNGNRFDCRIANLECRTIDFWLDPVDFP